MLFLKKKEMMTIKTRRKVKEKVKQKKANQRNNCEKKLSFL
jgi:hypothetical protein